MPVTATFRGEGWGLPVPLSLRAPLESIEVPADRPDLLNGLLGWLDGVARCGDEDLIAAGFLTYEAGVALEGSAARFRPPTRTPLAAFSLFRISGSTPEPSTRSFRAEAGSVSSLDQDAWRDAVEAIRDGIERGDVYQVNLTRRITLGAFPADRLAEVLFAENPVPYAVTFVAPDYSVVSNSPELFLDVDLPARVALSAPIKGTIARGDDDDLAAETLLASEKDAAEHLMIVDLVRNDLGKVSMPGRVSVSRLRTVLTFRHLLHLESLVRGELRPDVRLSDVLVATMPGGSITGAPKRASLRFIHELEPVPRGPYTGAAGYVRGNGRAVFNIAIRTAICGASTLDYHTGGGIVWDSDPEREWLETETKARELVAVLQGETRT